MADVSKRKRVQSGVKTAGQFDNEEKSPSGVVLAGEDPMADVRAQLTAALESAEPLSQMPRYVVVVRDPDAPLEVHTFASGDGPTEVLAVGLGSQFVGSPNTVEQAVEWATAQSETAMSIADSATRAKYLDAVAGAVESFPAAEAIVELADSMPLRAVKDPEPAAWPAEMVDQVRYASAQVVRIRENGMTPVGLEGEYDSYPLVRYRLADGREFVSRRVDLNDSSELAFVEAAVGEPFEMTDRNPGRPDRMDWVNWSDMFQMAGGDEDELDEAVNELDFVYSGQFSGRFQSDEAKVAFERILRGEA